MDAKKIYTLVALSAYYNKVIYFIHIFFRVTNNVQEHLLNFKEWVQLNKDKNMLIWLSVYLLNIHPNKLQAKKLNVQEEIVKVWSVNMIQLAEIVELISQLVLLVENPF